MNNIEILFQKIKNQPNLNIEFEVRFGYFSKSGSFIPGVKENIFKTLQNYYNYENNKLQIIETKIFEKFPNKMIETIEEGPYKMRNLRRVKKTFIKSKKKIDKYDDIKNDLRYAYNHEELQYAELNKDIMKILNNTKPSMIRKKERNVIVLDNSFELHLTKVSVDDKIKYEIEIEYINKPNDNIQLLTKKLDKHVTDIKKFIQIGFISKKILQSIFDIFPNNLNKILNRPATLTKNDLSNLIVRYTVTDKADGERYILLVDKFGFAFLINNNFNMVPLGQLDKKFKNSIFDGEFIQSLNTFMIFDCIQYKGKNNINFKLLNRLYNVNDFVNNVSITRITIKSKTFYIDNNYLDKNDIKLIQKIDNVKIPKNYKNFITNLWKKRSNNFRYKLDGLIFTPLDGLYKDDNKKIFKWKDEHTLDVRVKYSKSKNIWKFDVNRFGQQPDYLNIYYKPIKSINFDLINGDIVEFIYSHKYSQFIPYRKRTDKLLPNARKTADGVLMAIDDDIQIENLVNINPQEFGSMYYQESNQTKYNRKNAIDINMRKFHNEIKSQLISFQSKGKKFLLDLAVGKGGDYYKWKKAGFDVVLGIDISKKSLDEFKKRIPKNNKMDIYIVHGDSSKDILSGKCALDNESSIVLNNFFKKYPNVRFDKIVCNFAIHYMFMDQDNRSGKERISTLFKNVKKLINFDGTFVGTFISGKKIDKINKKIIAKKNNQEFYRIDKVEPYFNKPKKILSYSDVFKSKFIHNQITINRTGWNTQIPENVVYDSVLNLVAKFNGLERVDNFKSFEKYYQNNFQLSNDEKKISFLHKTFIFKKKIDDLLTVAKKMNIKSNNVSEICNQIRNFINNQ